MDSADLVDRYRRYKSGTTKIFDYIIAATRNLPEFANILPSVHAANKAIKQAKKRPDRIAAADAQVRRVIDHDTPCFHRIHVLVPCAGFANSCCLDVQVTVTTSKLVKLAELVAKHSKPVPRSIITLLTDVIRGRKVS